ncbi:GMC oxidoreductase [Parachitinimonas caeni]|uniref:GMC oxidoreductase n=1 Tax=Parachitinimonas caeni TaxID=3031301 RepID=A0ABT7DZ02_9NEIS|nr:GMC oxidoreductase [Parachitinimonas caeni]MDK2124375.1 GMC oxidoreductase [Parachitinimonas caeni]
MGNKIDQLYFKTFDQIKNEKYDYIVIGGGAYGTSFSHRMLEQKPDARILILEKGDYLIPDHIQNLPPAYIDLNTTTGVRPWVFEGPNNLNFMPQIPFVGGRALYWNAWVPQPDSTELIDWPEKAIANLRDEWYASGEFIGRRYSLATPGNDNLSLANLMRDRLFSGLKDIDGVTPQGNPFNLDSPMAIGHGQPAEGFAKFSPIPTLIESVQRFPNLAVSVSSEVVRLIADGRTVTSIETVAGTLDCKGANVILACNTLEAGFILSRSFPSNPLYGKNLCGHIRSFLPVRIPAQDVPALTDGLQVTGYYVPGESPDGRLFHVHVSVVHNPHPSDSLEVLYKVLPDASTPEAVETYQDPNYVVIMLHTMGEILGTRSADSPNYVGLTTQGENLVHMTMQPSDEKFWSFMDQVSYQTINVLAANAPVEYQHTTDDGKIVWKSVPPKSIRNSGMVHEAGTLWMGTDPSSSVTDTSGKMHNFDNVFALGSMTFPRPGSFNPTLTGIAQAFALAKYIAK